MTYTGIWNVIMKTPMGDRDVVLTVSQDEDALSGTMQSDGNTIEIQDGKVEDGRAKWKADLTSPMPLTLEFDVAQSNGALDGNVKLGMFGNSSVTGTRA